MATPAQAGDQGEHAKPPDPGHLIRLSHLAFAATGAALLSGCFEAGFGAFGHEGVGRASGQTTSVWRVSPGHKPNGHRASVRASGEQGDGSRLLTNGYSQRHAIRSRNRRELSNCLLNPGMGSGAGR